MTFTPHMSPSQDDILTLFCKMRDDLERIKPVWLALSNFFLDTDLDERDIKRIADVIAESKYSINETREILMNDLFPALLFNLKDMAGEWAGFSEEWLVERIEKTKNPNLAKKLYYKANFWMVRNYWNKLLVIINTEQVSSYNSGQSLRD